MVRPLPFSASSRGFTLVEMLVVLLIFGVILSMAAVVTRGISAAQKRSVTSTRMASVDTALVQFVQQQKRLPCPADGTKAASDVNAGIEGARNTATGCTGNQSNGVVPWRALGLSESDITDGWERRLTYRTFAILGADNGMDMSWCDPAGSAAGVGASAACNTACSNSALTSCTPPATFLANKGLMVKNISGTTVMDATATPHTGAGYVLISHGESGGGGYLNTGTLSTSSLTDGTEEMKNYASLPWVSTAATYYVDDNINDTSGNTHYDDIVLRPSVLSVASRAGLGPRSH